MSSVLRSVRKRKKGRRGVRDPTADGEAARHDPERRPQLQYPSRVSNYSAVASARMGRPGMSGRLTTPIALASPPSWIPRRPGPARRWFLVQ